MPSVQITPKTAADGGEHGEKLAHIIPFPILSSPHPIPQPLGRGGNTHYEGGSIGEGNGRCVCVVWRGGTGDTLPTLVSEFMCVSPRPTTHIAFLPIPFLLLLLFILLLQG